MNCILPPSMMKGKMGKGKGKKGGPMQMPLMQMGPGGIMMPKGAPGKGSPMMMPDMMKGGPPTMMKGMDKGMKGGKPMMEKGKGGKPEEGLEAEDKDCLKIEEKGDGKKV